eukprot:4246974-Alexandrium_andersonii.AAC.1
MVRLWTGAWHLCVQRAAQQPCTTPFATPPSIEGPSARDCGRSWSSATLSNWSISVPAVGKLLCGQT